MTDHHPVTARVPVTDQPPVARSGLRPDPAAVAAGALLVVAAALVGRDLIVGDRDLILGFPPVLATRLPDAGPGTPLAIGPAAARRLAWPPLLALSWAPRRRAGWPGRPRRLSRSTTCCSPPGELL